MSKGKYFVPTNSDVGAGGFIPRWEKKPNERPRVGGWSDAGEPARTGESTEDQTPAQDQSGGFANKNLAD